MRKLFSMVMMACLLTACGNAIHDANTQDELELAGYAQENPITRALNIPTEDGMLNVKCYVDETETEICKGTFADGNEASAEQLQAAISITHPKPISDKLNSELKDGCENKTLLVSLNFKHYEEAMHLPCNHTPQSAMECDGEIVSTEEAEKRNNEYRKAWFANLNKARNEMLDQFIMLNPGLVSEEIEAQYRKNNYESLNLKMPACDYQSFIEKNSPLLESIRIRGLVKDFTPETCNSPLEYKVLLNNPNYLRDDCSREPSFVAIDTKEAFLNHLNDLNEAPYATPINMNESDIDEVDFEHSTVLVLHFGIHSTSSKFNVDIVCKDKPINAYSDYCAGKPFETSSSCPFMILQVPKGEYDVNFVSRANVCE